MNDLGKIRNIGIIAHIDAGKTTLSERILFYTSKIHRMGEVHDGSATMDYLPEEQERGITIMSACTSCSWRGHSINLIDTPGHVDFTIEVERSLRVLDGAVGVFCAVGGVEPQSETVWRQSEHFSVPKLAFVNKLDRPGADFEGVLDQMKKRLHATPLPLAVPLGSGEKGLLLADLLSMRKIKFSTEDQGQTIIMEDLSAEEHLRAASFRDASLETLAENDETFLDQYLAAAFTPEDIKAALRRATLARKIVPVLCGSALHNTGVQPLLDAICDYLPSPAEAPPTLGHDGEGTIRPVPARSDGPFLALAFKILMEGGRKLVFMRIYSGTIKEGDTCRNLSAKAEDRLGRIYRMHADRRDQIAEAGAGDIVTVVGLRSARTGDTFAGKGIDLLLEPIEAYQPVINMALEPRNADEGKVLDEALARFCAEDPTLRLEMDEGSGHRIVSGMGELHLDVLLERIGREYKISPRAGNPQVVLRETILKTAHGDAEFDRELGKEHHFGKVSVAVSPLGRGQGSRIRLAESISSDPKPWPKAILDAVREGVADSLQSGAVTGYPVQDVDVEITAIARREGYTTAPGCHMAAGAALRNALAQASPVAMEPVMLVEMSVPESWLGAAIGLFNSASGKVEDIEERAGLKAVRGLAPLRRLFGFSTALRSATQGRAGLMMKFEKFDTL